MYKSEVLARFTEFEAATINNSKKKIGKITIALHLRHNNLLQCSATNFLKYLVLGGN